MHHQVQPCTTACRSTSSAARRLVRRTCVARRGSCEYTAAACTTAWQPSTAPRYGLFVQRVAHCDVTNPHPQRRQRDVHLFGPADQQTHVVTGTHRRRDRVGADEAGATSNQHLHRACEATPGRPGAITNRAVPSAWP